MLTIKEFKLIFFDTKMVVRSAADATKKNLLVAGAYVRKSAQQLIERAPYVTRKPRGQKRVDQRRATATPGHPPYSQTGIYKKFILFGYDPQSQSMVAGPALLHRRQSKPAGQLLEFGGTVAVAGEVRRYRQFPHMAPAFKENQDKFAVLFGDSISRVG